MNDFNPKALESDLGLEGYGAVIMVIDNEDKIHSHYLPFSQVREFYGIIHRGTFNGMRIVEGARSIKPTSRRTLDVMKDGCTRRAAVVGYIKKEAEFPAPLDVLYRHRGNLWRRARNGEDLLKDYDVKDFKSRNLFIPAARHFTISLADRSEFAFGLHPDVVVIDKKDGVRRTIQQGLEYQGLPPHYYSKLRQCLQTL
jgi:hypothetical protein